MPAVYDILTRYDRPDTLFYLDPPYHGFEDFYGKNVFSQEDYAALKDILKNMKGKFIMSMNDTPYIRETFADFNIEEVLVLYTINKNSNKKVTELLIAN